VFYKAAKVQDYLALSKKNIEEVQKPSIPKGTRDFGPDEAAKRQYIINIIKETFKTYGFLPIETPAMEQLSVLQGKYGDEGDQLLFKILNSGDFHKNVPNGEKESGKILPFIAEKGLRYDLTVPFARYVIMHQHEINFPFKRYQIQPVWRADRPQRGRYREFYQCDADIIGTNSSWNEVELTLLIHDVFKKLNFQDFELKINHRGILAEISALCGMQGRETSFCVSLDKLDKIGKEEVLIEIEKQGGNINKLAELLDLFVQPLGNMDLLNELKKSFNESSFGFTALKKYLDDIQFFTNREFKIKLDFSLARGLSYYTGMIYEVKPTSVKMGSICGGGRYDDLTGVFGLPGLSGIGISFGLDRIYDVLDELKLFPETSLSGPKVLISHFDEESFRHGIKLLDRLRSNGISADIYPEIAKFKKQLSYADKSKIPYLITIGSNEIATGIYSLKNMNSGIQTSGGYEDLLSVLKVDIKN